MKNIKKSQYKLIIKSVALVAMILSVFTLSACGGGTSRDISLYDLNKAMSDVADFSDMKYASSNDDNAEDVFTNISEMDYSKVKDYFINYASNGTGNADEIACIQVKNSKDINECVASLNAHLNKRIGLYSTYDKSQVEKLNKAIVTSNGDIAVLIVGNNAKEIEKAFNVFMGEK